MTIMLSERTEALLKRQAEQRGETPDSLADGLLSTMLEEMARQDEGARDLHARHPVEDSASIAAVAQGVADAEAGRTISLAESRRRSDELLERALERGVFDPARARG